MKPRTATTALAVTVVLAATALGGCSQMSTEPDQAGLHYKGGPLSSTKFSDCIDPGTRAWDGPSDPHYAYPAGQRTFAFTANKDSDTGVFTVSTKDPVELKVSGVVSFQLNTDCSTLQKFHERIGLKFAAYMDGDKTSDGWTKMLNVYLQQSLQRAMNEATQGLSWKALYSDTATKAQWEVKVKTLLPQYVEQAMGGKYLDHFNVTIQKPDLPQDLSDALRASQVAIEQNRAQQQRNVQVQSELNAIRALVAVLGPDGYNTYQAIKDRRIQVYPIPQGSSVVVGGAVSPGKAAPR